MILAPLLRGATRLLQRHDCNRNHRVCTQPSVIDGCCCFNSSMFLLASVVRDMKSPSIVARKETCSKMSVETTASGKTEPRELRGQAVIKLAKAPKYTDLKCASRLR